MNSENFALRLSGKSRRGPNRGYTGPVGGVKRPYFRVVGERSSLVEAPPTDFPDSLSTHSGESKDVKRISVQVVICTKIRNHKSCVHLIYRTDPKSFTSGGSCRCVGKRWRQHEC